MYVEDGEPGGPIVLRLGAMVKVGETVREFESSLERIVSERTGPLVLDLTDLEYMDSTTLGVLVGALHRLKSENREMVLVNPRERIASLLRVAKLDSLFSIYESVPEAIAAITRREEDTGVN
ncbi:MAG TPA: STAS domain-containing protein [Thermoanaerobaculia bacterium]|nr:STAS domain-containing protein [Thermoanaerobaculia bacterium]